jgi:hypothetical protein
MPRHLSKARQLRKSGQGNTRQLGKAIKAWYGTYQGKARRQGKARNLGKERQVT